MDKNNKAVIRTVKYPLKVNIWGCISFGGAETIHIFTDIMNAKMYTEILEEHLWPILYSEVDDYCFQHPRNKGILNIQQKLLKNS